VSEKRRVLIVDDDRTVANAIAGVVQMFSDRVVVVETMRAAKKAMMDKPFFIVLLDLLLPDSGVGETLESIPSFLALGATKIAVVTGTMVNPGIEIAAANCGASVVLSKHDADFHERIKKLIAE
jgi:DNA-binding NtrC family response regulator